MYDPDCHFTDDPENNAALVNTQIEDRSFDEIALFMAETIGHPEAFIQIALDAMRWTAALWRSDREREKRWDEILEAALRMIPFEADAPSSFSEGQARAALLWMWAVLCTYDERNRRLEEAAFNNKSEPGRLRRPVRGALQSVAATIEATRSSSTSDPERAMREVLHPFVASWSDPLVGPPGTFSSRPLDTNRLTAALRSPQTESTHARWQREVVAERLNAITTACSNFARAKGGAQRLLCIHGLLDAYDSLFFCLNGYLPSHPAETASDAHARRNTTPPPVPIRSASHVVFLPPVDLRPHSMSGQSVSLHDVSAVLAALRQTFENLSRLPMEASDPRLARTVRAIDRVVASRALPGPHVEETPFARSAPSVPTFIGVAREARPAIGFQSSPSPQRPVTLPEEGHLMTVGATGTGKTSATVIPTVLTYEGPIVVIDPKGQVYDVTHERRRAMGDRVWRIAPYGGLGVGPSDGLNPLDLVDRQRIGVEAKRLARQICDPSTHTSRVDPFWFETGQDILAGVVAHLAIDRSPGMSTLREASRIAEMSLDDSRAATQRIAYWSTSELARSHVGKLHEADSPAHDGVSRTGASVRISYRHQVTWLSDPLLAPGLDRTTVDLDRIERGEGFALYLTVPPEQMATQSSLLRLLISSLLTLMLRRKARPKRNTLFLLDEAVQLGEMEELRLLCTQMRGYGAQLWTIWQDPAQFMRLYRDWATLVLNTHTVVWLGAAMGDGVAVRGAELMDEAFFGMLRTNDHVGPKDAIIGQQGKRPQVVHMPGYFEEPRLAGLYRDDPREAERLRARALDPVTGAGAQR